MTALKVISYIQALDQNQNNAGTILINTCFRNQTVPVAVQYPVLSCRQMDWDQCIYVKKMKCIVYTTEAYMQPNGSTGLCLILVSDAQGDHNAGRPRQGATSLQLGQGCLLTAQLPCYREHFLKIKTCEGICCCYLYMYTRCLLKKCPSSIRLLHVPLVSVTD